jgi:pimeloyl-ACP methyl ester carboxylesterase
LVKASKPFISSVGVRTRRAYFDCQFGQLHVRTAFPTTGGFDEQVTLICLHPDGSSGRIFSRFLPEIADVRSVYAPDLPGFGESDSSPARSSADAAAAVSDLANDLRLRQIDLLGFAYGAEVAMELSRVRPQLVRRVVLTDIPGKPRLAATHQQHWVVDLSGYPEDPFNTAAQALAKKINAFLLGRV